MLDDKVWQVLAEIPAAEALLVIEDAGEALANPQSNIRNINAYFMVSSKFLIGNGSSLHMTDVLSPIAAGLALHVRC